MKKLYFIPLGIFILFSGFNCNASDLPKAQALFIYNFLKNTDWPENSVGEEYIIGIAGQSEVFTVLKELTNNREFMGKKIRVVQCNNCTDLVKCQVVFIPKEKYNYLPEIMQHLKGKQCLTIFENYSNVNSLSAIDLIEQNNKLVFRVNAEKLREQKLRISSNVLDLSI